MWDFIGDVWGGAWDTSPVLGVIVLILYVALGAAAIAIGLALLAIALALVAAALTILLIILAGCMGYGSVVGTVRGFINYFAAFKDEVGA